MICHGVDPMTMTASKIFRSISLSAVSISLAINGAAAHISIGRKLHPEDIEIAQDLFEEVSLNFLCEKIAIRKFNDEKGQYEVIYEFCFLGNPPKQGQLSFFQ